MSRDRLYILLALVLLFAPGFYLAATEQQTQPRCTGHCCGQRCRRADRKWLRRRRGNFAMRKDGE